MAPALLPGRFSHPDGLTDSATAPLTAPERKPLERLVGVAQWEDLDLRLHRDLRSELQELLAVARA